MAKRNQLTQPRNWGCQGQLSDPESKCHHLGDITAPTTPMNTHTPLQLLICCSLALSAGAADWPQWRGPNRDGCSTETGLLKQWPDGGPKVLWQVNSVGVGYSSVAIQGDRIFTQGDLDGVEHIICLNAK